MNPYLSAVISEFVFDGDHISISDASEADERFVAILPHIAVGYPFDAIVANLRDLIDTLKVSCSGKLFYAYVEFSDKAVIFTVRNIKPEKKPNSPLYLRING